MLPPATCRSQPARVHSRAHLSLTLNAGPAQRPSIHGSRPAMRAAFHSQRLFEVAVAWLPVAMLPVLQHAYACATDALSRWGFTAPGESLSVCLSGRARAHRSFGRMPVAARVQQNAAGESAAITRPQPVEVVGSYPREYRWRYRRLLTKREYLAPPQLFSQKDYGYIYRKSRKRICNIPGAGSCAAMDSAKAEDLKSAANRSVAASDFEGAVSALTEAIALRPGLKELWSNRAFARSAMGRHSEALVDAQQCIAMAPSFSKGYLRAGRALLALGQPMEAVKILECATNRMPQDYALSEALEDALAMSTATPGSEQFQEPRPPPPETSPIAPPSIAEPPSSGGLASSYYYAAVPASERKLPTCEPLRIDPASREGPASDSKAAASGAVRDDIERKGAHSYYYAHDRRTDFTVPTVPKRLNSDGTLSPWRG